MTRTKTIDELTVEDLQKFPIWEFTNSEEHTDETAVRPIKTVPVKTLTGRMAATEVLLANGSERWALIGNVVPANPMLTRHFLTLTIFDHGKSFALARYHDIDAARQGPAALGRFLRLPVDAVFPISYDLRGCCAGDKAALKGIIDKEPSERLTRAEIIALAVPRAPKD